MRLPGNYDFTVQRGTFGDKGALIIGLENEDGTPIATDDITRIDLVAGRWLAKSWPNGGLLFDQSTATVTWSPTEAEVLACPYGATSAYSLEIAYQDGSGFRALEGRMIGKGVGGPNGGC